MSSTTTVTQLRQMWKAWPGNWGGFAQYLRCNRILHLSYSQINTLQQCEHLYVDEYINVSPEDAECESDGPMYFAKGTVFHEAMAELYSLPKRKRLDWDGKHYIPAEWDEEDQLHLSNALETAKQVAQDAYQVVAVEKPYFFKAEGIDTPFIAVIDLLMRDGDTYWIIDHKTGKQFNYITDIQAYLYEIAVKHQHRAKEVKVATHAYRWVNNLKRIRKPAFQQTVAGDFEEDEYGEIHGHQYDPEQASYAVQDAAVRIAELQAGDDDKPSVTGDCYYCHINHRCEHKVFRPRAWY